MNKTNEPSIIVCIVINLFKKCGEEIFIKVRYIKMLYAVCMHVVLTVLRGIFGMTKNPRKNSPKEKVTTFKIR